MFCKLCAILFATTWKDVRAGFCSKCFCNFHYQLFYLCATYSMCSESKDTWCSRRIHPQKKESAACLHPRSFCWIWCRRAYCSIFSQFEDFPYSWPNKCRLCRIVADYSSVTKASLWNGYIYTLTIRWHVWEHLRNKLLTLQQVIYVNVPWLRPFKSHPH